MVGVNESGVYPAGTEPEIFGPACACAFVEIKPAPATGNGAIVKPDTTLSEGSLIWNCRSLCAIFP